MQLTGQQIIKCGIVTNYCEEGIQQQGVDVRIAAVKFLQGSGMVRAKGKTILPKTHVMEPHGEPDEPKWLLQPGYYEIDLMEGVNMPENAAMYFKTRSSLVRNGAIVESGQFDAGFCTEQAGCFLHVIRPVLIEKGARIAQAIVHTSDPVRNIYRGQFQGDKQRHE